MKDSEDESGQSGHENELDHDDKQHFESLFLVMTEDEEEGEEDDLDGGPCSIDGYNKGAVGMHHWQAVNDPNNAID